MITLKKSRTAACLTLLLSGCALAGLGQTTYADTNMTPQKGLAFAPVVKIDRAMQQERETLPDGTAHTRTYWDSAPEQSAQDVSKAGAAPATVHKV